MSKQEVKDEYKQTEGDPHVKAKQRQKQRQISRGQIRQAVPSSSAVVTNPTHLAIALKYTPEMEAPLVMAKGEDAMAILIRQLAEQYDVPIFEDKDLARAMYPLCIVDRVIPPEFYMAVATIIAQLMKQKQQNELVKLLNEQMKKTGGGAGQSSPPPGAGGRTWDAPGPTPNQNNQQPPDRKGPSSIFD